MPMCSFGCDDLYEKGYLAVRDGKIVDLHTKPVTPIIKQYIRQVNVHDSICHYCPL
jgi:hypothetical protein